MHPRAIVTTLLASLVTTISAIPTISVKGNRFFTSEGEQYFIKGVAYQLTPHDPLIDATQCGLDARLMKTLGANAIRVYHVDSDVDHTECMSIFAEAGIYLFVDLDTFSTQIEQDSPHWNETQLKEFGKVMGEFQKYDNTAGFFVGNEVLTTGNGSVAAPYVKAAARDLKAYQESKHYRKVPIGYSAADIATLRPMLQNYLACGTNPSETIDFFSLNAYEWCGSSSYTLSGYKDLTEAAATYNVPIFFSETGCNTVRPRDFSDQAAIFGPEMSPYWSGAIVYEWIQELNDYGLVSYGDRVDPSDAGAPPDGFHRSGTPTPVAPDFDNLKGRWETLKPVGVREDAYAPSLTPPPCPQLTAGAWEVEAEASLPALGQTYEPVTSGVLTGSAATATASGSVAGMSDAARPTGAASGRREVAAMGAGLMGVMLAFVWWL